MRVGLGVRLAAVALILAILWFRIGGHRHVRSAPQPPVIDKSVTSPLNQQGGDDAPAEAYVVYSDLYREPFPEPLAVAEDSVADIPQVNGSCLQPSTAQEREMTEAFEKGNLQSHRWRQSFAIPQGVRLLTQAQAAEAEACVGAHGQGAGCESYRLLKHVRYLGVPGFDRAHTHALVSVLKRCGKFCGSGGIFEVEKSGAAWKRAEPSSFTRECSWMY